MNLNNFLCKLGLKGNNKDSNKIEIQTRKSEIIIRNIISDCVGSDNIKIRNIEKNHLRFSCQMYVDKKKLIFNLNLVEEEKNKSIITSSLIEGDCKSYEKIITNLKEQLE